MSRTRLFGLSVLTAILLSLPTASAAAQPDCQQPSTTGCDLPLGGFVKSKLHERGEKHRWLVNVPYATNLILWLYNPNSEYDLYLYDQAPNGDPGTLLASSVNEQGQDQSVLRYLTDPGTYLVYVSIDPAPDRNNVADVDYWLHAGELGRGIPPADRPGPMSVEDAATADLVGWFHQRADVLSVAFSPEGKYIAASSTGLGEVTTAGTGYLQEFGVKLWDLARGVEIRTFLGGGESNVQGVDFSPDGKLLYAAWGNNVIAWQVSDAHEVHRFRGGGHEISSLALSPNGKLLATGDVDNLVKVWDTTTGDLLTTSNTHRAPVTDVEFSPNGRLLASASEDKSVLIADMVTGKELGSLFGHTDAVTSLSFSPNGKLLASGGLDNLIKVWDMSNADELKSIKGRGRVLKVLFSPDSSLLAASYTPNPDTLDGGLIQPLGEGTEISLIDPSTGRELRTLGQFYPAYGLAFSPNGQVLASGGTDHLIAFWGVLDLSRFALADQTDAQPYVLLSDNFDNIEAAQFPISREGETRSIRKYADGEYIIRKQDPSLGVVTSHTTETYADASIALDARVVGNPTDVGVALGCRDNPSGAYRLTVWPGDGGFSLSRWDNGVSTPLVSYTDSAALHLDNESNHLELICAGTAITVMINGQQVAAVLDDTYRKGDFWMGVQREGEVTEARFKNALILLR